MSCSCENITSDQELISASMEVFVNSATVDACSAVPSSEQSSFSLTLLIVKRNILSSAFSFLFCTIIFFPKFDFFALYWVPCNMWWNTEYTPQQCLIKRYLGLTS